MNTVCCIQIYKHVPFTWNLCYCLFEVVWKCRYQIPVKSLILITAKSLLDHFHSDIVDAFKCFPLISMIVQFAAPTPTVHCPLSPLSPLSYSHFPSVFLLPWTCQPTCTLTWLRWNQWFRRWNCEAPRLMSHNQALLIVQWIFTIAEVNPSVGELIETSHLVVQLPSHYMDDSPPTWFPHGDTCG